MNESIRNVAKMKLSCFPMYPLQGMIKDIARYCQKITVKCTIFVKVQTCATHVSTYVDMQSMLKAKIV